MQTNLWTKTLLIKRACLERKQFFSGSLEACRTGFNILRNKANSAINAAKN